MLYYDNTDNLICVHTFCNVTMRRIHYQWEICIDKWEALAAVINLKIDMIRKQIGKNVKVYVKNRCYYLKIKFGTGLTHNKSYKNNKTLL